MWVVSVPVWGERYLDIFERATWPALKAALRHVSVPVQLIIHTDDPQRVHKLVSGTPTETFPVPAGDGAFGSLSDAHRAVLARAQTGDWICLLTADLVLSVNALQTCEQILRSGKKLVSCMGMRVDDSELPEPGMPGRLLLDWAWEHRHPMTRECTWPDGTSYDVWRMYFEKDGNVICRLCLPHPIALEKDRRRLKFFPTIDVNVSSNYEQKEIYLITNPDELALIEMSPTDKEFMITETMRHRYDHGGPSIPAFVKITHRLHRWFWSQPIVIRGEVDADVGDREMKGLLLGGTRDGH